MISDFASSKAYLTIQQISNLSFEIINLLLIYHAGDNNSIGELSIFDSKILAGNKILHLSPIRVVKLDEDFLLQSALNNPCMDNCLSNRAGISTDQSASAKLCSAKITSDNSTDID